MTSSALHVEASGEGPAVLLLHSSGLSGRQFRRLVPELARRGLRVVVPDLSGHGASTAWPSPEPFSFRTDVARVVELLNAEGGAHVVGHSYGGLLALHAALAQPASIRSLTLYEPVAFGVLDRPEDADARATLEAVGESWGVTAEENEAWLRRFVDYWGGAGAWQSLREEARAEFRRIGWVVREGVRTLMEDTTRSQAFAALSVPTRLFFGELSPIASRRVAERLAEVIGGARLHAVAGVGHLGPVARADIVNPLLLEGLFRDLAP